VHTDTVLTNLSTRGAAAVFSAVIGLHVVLTLAMGPGWPPCLSETMSPVFSVPGRWL
jgi:hypothetical protein